MKESELLVGLRQQDPKAFAILFDLYSDKVFRLAVGLLEDDFEAECVVQDAFLRLIERLDQFEGRSQLGTWLYRVAYNLTMDRLRKRQPMISINSDDEEEKLPIPQRITNWQNLPEHILTTESLAEELDRAIASLPEKYRIIFMLREIEEMSVTETAVITNLTPANVKVRLHRARLLLRERLTEKFEASLL